MSDQPRVMGSESPQWVDGAAGAGGKRTLHLSDRQEDTTMTTEAEKPATIGDTIDATFDDWSAHPDLVTAICAALGVDPSDPLANLVVLQPGQHVVEYRTPTLKEPVAFQHGIMPVQRWSMDFSAPVVVRSAVQEVTP